MSFQPLSATIVEGRFDWAQFPPHASLAGWISTYWTLRVEEGRHVVRTLPDGCVDLTIDMHARRAYLSAPQRHAETWARDEPSHLLGARMLPGSAALMGVDVDALAPGWTPLEALLPKRGVASLVRDVARGKDIGASVAALEAFLADRLLNRALDPRLSSALRCIFAEGGDIEVAALARRAGASPRTLARLFDRAIGLAPKRFARIVRLQCALRERSSPPRWAEIASALGYSDQAHFIREVKALFGATPNEIARMASRTK